MVENEWQLGSQYALPWWCNETTQWCDMSGEQKAHWLLRQSEPRMCATITAFISALFTTRVAAAAAASLFVAEAVVAAGPAAEAADSSVVSDGQ